MQSVKRNQGYKLWTTFSDTHTMISNLENISKQYTIKDALVWICQWFWGEGSMQRSILANTTKTYSEMEKP